MKAKQALKRSSQSGTAIITVLGLISLICISSGYIAYTASQEMHASRVLRESLKAKLIAESGLNRAYNTLRANFSTASGLRLEEQFGGGKYIVTSIPDPDSPNRFKLVSNATCGQIGKWKVSCDVQNRPIVTSGTDPDDLFFELDYDILTGGIMDLKGNFNTEINKIHANGNINSKGSSSVSAVTISSGGTVTLKTFSGTKTVLQNQPVVNIRPANLMAAIDALKAYAEKNGAKYSDSGDIPENPPGGVAWCTSDGARWNGSGTGCFIFEGDASLQGGGHRTITSVNGFPALIVLGTGTVHINAQTVLKGAILVPNGSIFLNGSAEFYGPVLVGQTFTGSGTADLYAGDGQGFELPPDETTADNVVITAWH
jgi:co-chaperonin GroES (HSP10)